ncbi:MAG: DUF1156 domain-containing protein [Syntrophomonas sp.]
MQEHPKRLIEVDLPIKRISAHARREKSIRQGHVFTLHLWWARRPLGACRAVLCASLWPDPVDPKCPEKFKVVAREEMLYWAKNHMELLSAESFQHFLKIYKDFTLLDDDMVLRKALLDFITDFANWENSTVANFLETSRKLTQVAYESLGGIDNTHPIVIDPFAGGGSIPLEALRIGADTFASDLNPVAVLLNKVVLEYIPRYGLKLANAVQEWGDWIKKEAEKELEEFYPKDPDGSTPIAYLWARTICCEGPGCGAEVPLLRSMWLSKKQRKLIALRMIPNLKGKKVDFAIIENAKAREVSEGTIKRGSATCPICGYTTPIASVRRQLKSRNGGADDARLFCVVTTHPEKQGRFFRLPNKNDMDAIKKACIELERRKVNFGGTLKLVPDESTPLGGGSGAGRAFSQRNYGIDSYENFFTSRQALMMTTLVRLIINMGVNDSQIADKDFVNAVRTCCAIALDRQADHNNSCCTWNPSGPKLQHLFTRAAFPIVWDFAEAQPFGDSVGDWLHAIECVIIAINNASSVQQTGQIELSSALTSSLPDDIGHVFFTDPPYYDAIPYADLSDFFLVWLKRSVGDIYPNLLSMELSPKQEECIVDEVKGKDKGYFEKSMAQAMAEGRRVLAPEGIGIVVFAHKSTEGWEAQLQAMVDAGWIITASWPIDTEMGSRLRAMNSAALASSIHLVCRPRENADGSLRKDFIGDWRDVLQELPKKIHEWMPGLAENGVVGADAIFACLGPALEVFSRYSSVEKPNGDQVLLQEYMEHVWAAISREALSVVFSDADASGFEEDSRLTAIWLWTLSTAQGQEDLDSKVTVALNREALNGDERDSEDDEKPTSKTKSSGYLLEYDTARKIAQGLGAHLDKLNSIVEIKGDTARLLPVEDRARYLFGKIEEPVAVKKTAKVKKVQPSLFDITEDFEKGTSAVEPGIRHVGSPLVGATVLDRVHQSMLLFATGRAEAIKRFLVEDGIGHDQRFWKLAQALSALYPTTSDEKRWVDGVLARKKGLGL